MMIDRIVAKIQRLRIQLWVGGRKLLFSPEDFYKNHVGRHGIVWELLFVLTAGAIGAAGAYYGVLTIFEEFAIGEERVLNPQMPQMDDGTVRQLRFRAAHPILGVFAIWGFYTATYYIGAYFSRAHGTFFRLLKNVAWALVPYMFANIVFAAAYIATYNWWVDIDTDLPGLPERNAEFLIAQGHEALPLMVIPLVKILFVIWVAYIGKEALHDAMKVPKDQAWKIAAVPAVIHTIYLFVEFLERAGIM